MLPTSLLTKLLRSLSWADTAASTIGRAYGPRTPPLPASVSLAWLPGWVYVPGFLLAAPSAVSSASSKSIKSAGNGVANGVVKENPKGPKQARRLRLPFAPRKSTAGFVAACAAGALVALVFWGGIAGLRGLGGVAEMRAVEEVDRVPTLLPVLPGLYDPFLTLLLAARLFPLLPFLLPCRSPPSLRPLSSSPLALFYFASRLFRSLHLVTPPFPLLPFTPRLLRLDTDPLPVSAPARSSGADAGVHSQYSLAGQYLRSDGGAWLRRWVPEGVIGGVSSPVPASLVPGDVKAHGNTSGISGGRGGAQTTPERFGVGGLAGLVALVVVAGVVSGVAEALDLGGLDDNLTLPIISGGALMLFFRVWGWAVGAA
ncbi:hypothetical protein B0H17DRAFT_1206818 [Mycena rosella]|uniref:Uncharacterized protein n=1 Tax=Mycena rosella TaxID=1033263 RepID=A0AAD7GCH1_MYCRO|nr:hypothetical protein B0H17DRAFT_1206818 [Mycena rosella]